MIKTFKGKRTQEFHAGKRVKAFEAFSRPAQMKLDQMDAAFLLGDLNLPGNRLEVLKGDRKGQHSIRINRQYRICFTWTKDVADAVAIVDYH